MKKLRLELEELQVESFTTAELDGDRGTVEAYISVRCNTNYTCDPANNTCAYVETCGEWASCYVSCDGSCPYPCTNENSYCFNNSCFDCSYPDACTYP